ncbi:MAG: cysteine desulfurase family protein, partial [Nanoarchaeota archaeon]
MKGSKAKLITTSSEHPSVLEPAMKLKKDGCEVVFLDVDREGFVNVEQLRKEIKGAALVSIVHGNHEIGTLQDVREIGKICKENNVAFHFDASQSYTKTKIDVGEINATLLTVNSHKIHGPKGVAALYVKRGTRLNKLMYGGEQELNLRPGTENVVSIAGFAKAAEIAFRDYEKNNKKIRELRDKLLDKLLRIKNAKLNGPRDLEKRLINNINVSFLGKEGESLVIALSKAGICVSTGSACTSRKQGPSHILKAIKLSDKEIKGALRITLSRLNTEKEIDVAVEKIKEVVESG